MQLFIKRGGESRAFLRAALLRAYGIENLPELAYGAQGKPYFKEHPSLHFSLSHSGDLLLCGFSAFPIGVDLELLRPRGAALPRYALTATELVEYEAKGGDWRAFYTLWTKKEAFAKYTGEGILKSLRAPPCPDLCYRHYYGEGFCATVCGEETAAESLIWMEALDASQ